MTPADPDGASFADAVRLYQSSRADEAEAMCTVLLRREPRHAGALHLAGLLAYNRGDAARAAALLEQAVALNPAEAQAHNVLAAAQITLRRFAAAETSAARAAALRPEMVDAYCNRASALDELKRYDEALASWEQALALKPAFVPAQRGRAAALDALGRGAEAVAAFDRILAAHPDDGETWMLRGTALDRLGRSAEALESLTRAVSLRPTAHSYNARGVARVNAGDPAGALADYDASLAHDPTHAVARMNRGVALLQLGRLAQGWPGYEWRWRVPGLALPERGFTQPQWMGEDIAGKTILLHNEQGFGDALHFCRYAPMVAARGARVILEVQKSLVSLLADLEGVSEIVTRGAPLPAFDVHGPLLSLPLAFGTDLQTIPAPARYLRADSAKVAKWQGVLGAPVRPRIGLTWSGNPAQGNDANRSIPLADFLRALPDGFEYISLQKDLNAADAEALKARPDIRHFGAQLVDFSETAALCTVMDEVVTVCTSTAHLAGALGMPARVLLCFNPCWRWMLGREDSPWYPSLRLYRQERPRAWGPVLDRVRGDLAKRAPRVAAPARGSAD